MRQKRWIFILMIALIAGTISWTSISAVDTDVASGVFPTPTPVVDEPSLDPNLIPKFVNQVEKPGVYAPTLIKDARGNVIRREYTVSWAQTFQQILPPGFPQTRVQAFGGLQVPADSPNATPVFRRSVPGATKVNPKNNNISTPKMAMVMCHIRWTS